MEPTYDLHPSQPRWTHVALRVRDIDETIAWYEEFTPLRLLDRRTDDAGHGAWLGMPEPTGNPFILVLAQFFAATDPYGEEPIAVLAPFAHLGIEMPDKTDVDAMAARGTEADCLLQPPIRLPDPIGYVCMLADPDGNTVEFSWDQGVYSTVRDRWGLTS